MLYFFVVFWTTFLLSHAEPDLSNETIFVPTNEWQVVKPGQRIPPGLHVRHDLETGSTLAKLMDPDDNSGENSPVLVSGDDETRDRSKPSNDQLNSERLLISSLEDDLNESFVQAIRTKFRSYDELKADFERLNANVKTDFEILEEIMNEINGSDVPWSRLPVILEDLAYLLHQVDNGRLFSEKKGFTILQSFLVYDNITIQKLVFSAMSAAIQGNSFAKVAALQAGLLDTICMVLSSCIEAKRPENESLIVMSSVITTLSVLLRDFPSAQRHFFASDSNAQPLLAGFDLLIKIYRHKVSDELQPKMTLLRTRLHSLVSDLALERMEARQRLSTSPDENTKLLVKLYSDTDFESSLTASGWCDHLCTSLLHDMPRGVSIERLDSTLNHEARQKLLSSMLHLHPFCKHSLIKCSQLHLLLHHLEREYSARLNLPENKDDLFFKDMLQLVKEARELVDESVSHDRIVDEL